MSAQPSTPSLPELVCPAGTPAALQAAITAGADTIYFGFRDRTNARNFPGLNFSPKEAEQAIALCHDHGVKPMIALNTFPEAGQEGLWHQAVDRAAAYGAHAVILADIGLLDYASRKYPDLRLHVSVQASAVNPEAIAFYRETFNIQRIVLPRVFTVDQIREMTEAVFPIEAEVFILGGLCVMAEGRCSLSSFAVGRSPNKDGVCSPAEHVRYEQEGDILISRLGRFTINRFGAGDERGYPTLCKGRFHAMGEDRYLFEDPISLDATRVLPDLIKAGVAALKVEGRQRGKAYVAAVVGSLKQTLAMIAQGASPEMGASMPFLEGGRSTEGAYNKTWR